MSKFSTPTDLFIEVDDGVRLLASSSSVSDNLVFPAEEGQETVRLSPTGTLYTWTSQEFPPPSPPAIREDGEFSPFGVGYVEFSEGLLVEGRLTTCLASELAIGMPMKVVLVPFAGGETFAFAPADPLTGGNS